jgi:hypothetical protein
MVNTQIVEGRSSVVIFDGQLHLPFAEEVASYIKTIGKPVDRFILSHGHSDHWSGLQVLTERFPSAEVYAIAGVAELIRLRESKTLERAKRLYGDLAATRVTVPSRVQTDETATTHLTAHAGIAQKADVNSIMCARQGELVHPGRQILNPALECAIVRLAHDHVDVPPIVFDERRPQRREIRRRRVLRLAVLHRARARALAQA